ncbi:hypothetical protein PHMEG_000749 [Phytophthora megakarya]|uniref:Uncharacterized protein n=1 Tax=Phytophthora megakarya TaxID=4795 RepID=A0A225X4V3_9STRA|nr:hypothetical protein PHMEG_000749 [Phytophthora megakarya]
MTLDCVESDLTSNDEIQQVVNGLMLRLQVDKKALVGKRNIILSFLADVDLLAISDVVDPFLEMENLEDIEHQE